MIVGRLFIYLKFLKYRVTNFDFSMNSMFRSAPFGRGSQMLLRRLSSKGDNGRVVPASTQRKNVVLALALCGFVGGIYYT